MYSTVTVNFESGFATMGALATGRGCPDFASGVSVVRTTEAGAGSAVVAS